MISKPFLAKRSNQVAEYLRSLIHQQVYKPGDKLPPLHEMAGILKVSKSTIREALVALVAQNLIDVRHGKGYFIKEIPSSMDEPLNAKSLGEILFARILLEVPAAGLAAHQRSADHLQRLEACLAEMVNEGREHAAADLRFHTTVAEATGNSIIEGLIKSLAPRMEQTMKFSRVIAGSHRDLYQKHWDLYKAIEAGDASGARRFMFQHLNDTAVRLKILVPGSWTFEPLTTSILDEFLEK